MGDEHRSRGRGGAGRGDEGVPPRADRAADDGREQSATSRGGFGGAARRLSAPPPPEDPRARAARAPTAPVGPSARAATAPAGIGRAGRSERAPAPDPRAELDETPRVPRGADPRTDDEPWSWAALERRRARDPRAESDAAAAPRREERAFFDPRVEPEPEPAAAPRRAGRAPLDPRAEPDDDARAPRRDRRPSVDPRAEPEPRAPSIERLATPIVERVVLPRGDRIATPIASVDAPPRTPTARPASVPPGRPQRPGSRAPAPAPHPEFDLDLPGDLPAEAAPTLGPVAEPAGALELPGGSLFELDLPPDRPLPRRRAARSEHPPSAAPPPSAPARAPEPARPSAPAPAPSARAASSAPRAPEPRPSAPARAPEAPPPTPSAPREVDERAQRALLADFTKALVSSLNRKTYYEPGHPKYFVVRDELFDKLRAVVAEDNQVGYLLERGTVPTIWVDGVGRGRTRLSDVLVGSAYETFAPRFIAYFDRFELVLLAFRAGVTREELGAFVDIVSDPDRAYRAEPLGGALAKQNVVGISCVTNADLDIVDAALPWQVRVCIARLTRDLRAMPLWGRRSAAEFVRIKELLVGDVVRPLLDPSDVKLLVHHAKHVDAKLRGVPELAGFDLAETIVRVLWPPRLPGFAEVLLADVLAAREKGEEARDSTRKALTRTIERLLVDEVPDAEPVLRKLYDAKVVELDALPPELAEWILAEGVFDARTKGDRSKLPLATRRDRRVAAKVARLAVVRDRVGDSLEILEQLRALLGGADAESARDAEEALERMLGERDLARLVERVEEDASAVEQRRLLRALGRFSAPALVARVVAGGRDARPSAVTELLGEMPAESMPAIAQAIATAPLAAAAACILLGLAARQADFEACDAAVRFTRHPDASVRISALEALAAVKHPEERGALERALADASIDVVRLARLALLDRHFAAEHVTEHFVAVLAHAQAETSEPHLLLALKHLEEKPPPSADARLAAVRAIDHLLEVRPPEARGLFSRGPAHDSIADYSARAKEALGVSAKKESSLLGWLKRGK
jgi:hypothetical protein